MKSIITERPILRKYAIRWPFCEWQELAEHGSTVISARAMTGACETTALPPNSEVPGKTALIQPILKSRDYHAPDDTWPSYPARPANP